MKRKVWYLLLIAGVVSVPLLTDYVIVGSSLSATLSQIEVISQGIGRVFPIRTGPLASMDYGYSAASLQGNLFYLIPAFLHLLGMTIGGAYKWTVFLCNVTTAVIAYGCFKGCTKDSTIGLLGSLLYTWSPYRCSEMYLTGDLGDLAAWCFLPLVLLGLYRLYAENENTEENKKAWVTLVWGYSLTLLSSTALFFGEVVVTALTMLLLWKKTMRRDRLLNWGKTVGVTALVNAWFLVPLLARMRNAEAVGTMLVADVRNMGMYLSQYFTVFSKGKSGVNLGENGLLEAQAMGPGIAVTALLLLSLWRSAVGAPGRIKGKQEEEGKAAFRRAMMWGSLLLMLLSTYYFPWDLLQNRNLLFSAVLALMHTPAKLGIAAGAVMVLLACLTLEELRGIKAYQILLLAVVAVSFLVTQFLLGSILTSRGFARQDELEAFSKVEFLLITQESGIWRASEAISGLTLCGCVGMGIMRRRKRVKEV